MAYCAYLWGRLVHIWRQVSFPAFVILAFLYGWSRAHQGTVVKTAGIIVSRDGILSHYVCDGSDKEYESILRSATTAFADAFLSWPKDSTATSVRIMDWWKKFGAPRGADPETAFTRSGLKVIEASKTSSAAFKLGNVSVDYDPNKAEYSVTVDGHQTVDSGMQTTNKARAIAIFRPATTEERDRGKIFVLSSFALEP